MSDRLTLIAVENKVNAQLLHDTLKPYYTVKHIGAAGINDPFNLGIFDGVNLKRFQRQLLDQQQGSSSNIFRPILFVTSRQDIGLVTQNLWQIIDEIIFTPIERLELLARVEVLLRANNYSVRLSRLNAHIHETAVYSERQRLAQELHDSVSQMLFLASTLAQTIPHIQQTNPELALQRMNEVSQLSRSALAEMRLLLLEFRPNNILKASISELIDQLATAIQGRVPIEVESTVDEVGLLPQTVHLTLYKIAQEALNNVVKHSHAGKVHIALTRTGTRIDLNITDNGVGFDPNTANGQGLQNMEEKARSIGATLTITSQPNRAGTQIAVSVPLNQDNQ